MLGLDFDGFESWVSVFLLALVQISPCSMCFPMYSFGSVSAVLCIIPFWISWSF